MKVLKFGGSSVGSVERVRGVLDILASESAQGHVFTVVFSAFSGVTDALLGMGKEAAEGETGAWEARFKAHCARHAEVATALCGGAAGPALAQLQENHDNLHNLLLGAQLLREASARTLDHIASFGERNAALILSHALRARGIDADYLDARRVIRTDRRFGAARVDFQSTNALLHQHFAGARALQVVTGFIGSTAAGETTTLGRGGSDYTAAILGAALGAEVIEIWTDVDGVMTADPRKVPRAFSVPEMSFAEALELSHFGAKVIYPPTILPALEKKIPLSIKNTFNPSHPGTRVSSGPRVVTQDVRGISSIPQVGLLTLQGSGMQGVPGIAARLFGALARSEVNVILITQGSSEQSITFAVAPGDLMAARRAVEAEFALEQKAGLVEPIREDTGVAVVAVIGEGMRTRPGVASRLFGALATNGVNAVAIAQGSSELNISVVIPAAEERRALRALHDGFFLSGARELNVFLAGVGQVGQALLAQFAQSAERLRQRSGIDLRLRGVASSSRMLLDAEGVDPAAARDLLTQKGTPLHLEGFVEGMKALRLPSSVFIDCTASDAVPTLYAQILEASISISTPNKQAMSGAFAGYRHLKSIAERRGVCLGYETNVGAGLPVLTTLADLLASGDDILSVEGVLSGSMSFVFNQWSASRRFSALIREAQARGYTEPDPRVDLSGADVRKKLLILARECGLPLEAEGVAMESFLPQPVLAQESVDAFLTALEREDEALERRRAEAERQGAVLRLVARLDGAAARIGVQAYPRTHPFAGLEGSENMLVFTTARYRERPLVIRGPGAGADVTAAGVFAEVLRIGNVLFAGRRFSG